MEQMTQLAMIAGSALSLILGYVPKASEWYEARTPAAKRQIMGLLLIIVAMGSFVASCYSPFKVASCSEAGGWELVGNVITALLAGTAANQTTHMITKK